MADMKLRECPFCSEQHIKLMEWPSDGTICEVFCLNCKSSTGAKFTKKEAVRHWNTRVTDSVIEAQEAEIKRLREALEFYATRKAYDGDYELYQDAGRIAQEALKGK